MIWHNDFPANPKGTQELSRLIRTGKIRLAGNQKLKIYGMLNCKSGKRMLRKNRVFFSSEEEAIDKGFRPCGHCMRAAYLVWKSYLLKHLHK